MDILSKLSDALKELMLINDLTEKTLAEQTGIPIACISVYVRGLQLPYIDTLLKLADYFKCSVDYLLGLTDNFCKKDYNYSSTFLQRFNELLVTNNCTTYKKFGINEISKSSFYDWKRGKSLPTLENLVKLAQRFNRSIDYILGREYY